MQFANDFILLIGRVFISLSQNDSTHGASETIVMEIFKILLVNHVFRIKQSFAFVARMSAMSEKKEEEILGFFNSNNIF